ncbi:sensor histidine kinase [Rhodococcus sp. P1Y]|uniref:sensor histidine kinase n=1 Tax=Rhodococcus sp. P1Y TaxID=1302308 RepID=UPI001292FA9E|nr:histidine kinase [Rhodococcus sp. P1Y]
MNRRGSLSSSLYPPLGFVTSRWPWRALLYCASTVVVGGTVLILSIPLLIVMSVPGWRDAAARTIVTAEVSRLSVIEPVKAQAWKESNTAVLRHAAYSLVAAAVLAPVAAAVLVGGAIAVPTLLAAPVLVRSDPISVFSLQVTTMPAALALPVIALPTAVLILYLCAAIATANSELAHTVPMRSTAELEVEVDRLQTSRTGLLDAFDTERARIEGMLHDGVQHRLVAVGLSIGLAEQSARDDRTRELLETAHRQVDESMRELRRTIRGILPQALTESGLLAATEDLLGELPIEVSLNLPTDYRPPSRVEQVSYFVISEVITNSIKHAQADAVSITAAVIDGTWRLVISDNGIGGADPASGRGLTGLSHRVDALGGTISVSSPLGRGTTVEMRCPIPA